MKNLIIAVAILALIAGGAVARGPEQATMAPYEGQKDRAGIQVWYDDLETGAPGWTHGDDSAQPIRWHIDSYMAYSGNSWWCGTFDYDTDGGYGNNWTQYLTSPEVNWTGYTYPVLFYFYRNDTEPAYDFSFAEAESSGAFVPLNRGYDGVHAWTQGAYYIGDKDNPAKIRFSFYSDGAYSDADGYYPSVGGAFSVDDIVIMDYPTTTLFTDDADANVFMTPSVPPAAGDYWRLASNYCQAYSDPHYWTCTSPDTTFVPANLQNWLQTPVVDISSYDPAVSCTLYFVNQLFMPADEDGSWQEWSTNDNGATWVRTGWWYGDQCDAGYGPCDHFLQEVPVSWPGWYGTQQVAVMWIMLTGTTGNANPACAYLSAGMDFDDTWIEVFEPTPVEPSSWGKIKSMYR
jgi:hypothetical protein